MLSVVKRLPFYRAYSTRQNKNYWLKKDDEQYWRAYLKTWNDPHREVISAALKQFPWTSLIEVGCGSGPNVINIIKNNKGKQVAGIDINSTAIKVLQSSVKGGLFKVGSGEDIMMSDKSTDVTLTDAYLIYIGPLKIKKHLLEIKRITRNYIVLCEYYNSSLRDRWKLRILSGRHSYNYKRLLRKLGFYDIQIFKMPKVEDNDDKFRHIIIAKVPLRL